MLLLYRVPLWVTGLLMTLLVSSLMASAQRDRHARHCLADEIHRRTTAEEELRRANAQTQTILESITDAFLTLDSDWRFTYLNNEAERRIGRPRADMIGKNVWEEFPQAIGTSWDKEYRRAVDTNTAVTFEVFTPGQNIWSEVRAYPSFEGLTVYFQNVTERKRAEEQLRTSEENFHAFMDNSPNLAWITDVEGVVEYISQPYCQMLGRAGEDLRGKNLFDLYPAEYAQDVLANIREVARTRRLREVVETVPDGRGNIRHFLVHEFPLGEVSGRVLIGGAATDITARIHAEQQIQAANEWLADANAHLQTLNAQLEAHVLRVNEQAVALEAQQVELTAANIRLEALATTDGLTGLKNHRTFQERLMEEFARNLRYHAPLSLILLDVDLFKQFNDIFGHPVGDQVLKSVAGILQQQARNSDLAARYGGEEFALLLPNTDAEGALQMAERLRAAIAEQSWPKRLITVSLGVSTLHPLMPDAGTLVTGADRALYHSKREGRNRVTHVERLPEPSDETSEKSSSGHGLTAAELQRAYDSTIEGWSRVLDLRDKETEGHSVRVTELTLRLARQIGLSEEELVYIRWGALLHDIGKMGVPDHILLKPGPLTPEEWSVMQKHPTLAYDMLSMIGFLLPALDIPRYHHEKWDGSGYPCGLKGEQIPLSARLFAIVDVWDALCNDRPYRAAWTADKARAYIQEQAGTHFDPQVVDIFLRIVAALRDTNELCPLL